MPLNAKPDRNTPQSEPPDFQFPGGQERFVPPPSYDEDQPKLVTQSASRGKEGKLVRMGCLH
jgi:hypothetical protein